MAGALEFLRLQTVALQLTDAAEFVKVSVGGLEFRARAQVGNVVRGVLGALQAADIRKAGGTAAEIDRRISERVNAQFEALEEGDDEGLGEALEGLEDALSGGELTIVPD